jgi:hypothetical protein
MSSLGAETLGKFELLSGFSGNGEGAEGFGGVEVGAELQERGDVAEDAALEGGGFGEEACDVECDALVGSGGAAPTADWPTTKDQAGGETGHFRLPPGLFVASELGHLDEEPAKLRIPIFELWKKLVTDSIAGEGEMAIGGVFAPGLVTSVKEGFDLPAAGLKERTENAALGKVEDRIDPGETLGPCAAEELGKDGFGLIVEGVCRGDRVERGFAKELAEPGVAEPPRGAFDGIGGQIASVGWRWRLRSAACFGGSVDAGFVEGDPEV